MADPVEEDAAAAVSADDDGVEDLYADLDEQVTAALAAAGESGGSNARDSDPATDGEGEVPEADANEAVDLGDGTAGYSSSDEESDDGLHIVLNEDAGAPPPVCRIEGCVAEGEDGEDSGSRMKGSYVDEGGWATVSGLQCKGLVEKKTLPIMGQVDRGRQHVFQRDYNLFLPRNSTIFDIDIEGLQQKPWRQQGVDLTDYFNFNLDEEGWRKYWCSMKQLRLGTRSLANETSGLDQESYEQKSVEAMPKAENYSGFEGRNSVAKPMGRAIHVEGSAHERVPSADLWRPIQRDSDVVIQVNMTLSPSSQSTSDDSSKLNRKCVTTERMPIYHPGDRRLKGSSFVVERVVEKECDGDSSEFSGSKLDRRDSSCARAQSSSPDYSDTLSGESKEDFYFKRANRHSDSRDFFEDTKLQDEHVNSDFYRHSSKSDRENSESRSRSYTPSPADDRNHKASKLFGRGEAPLVGRGNTGDFFVDCNIDHDLVKSGRNGRKERKRQSVDGGRYAIFVEKEKSTDRYPSRYGREYEKKRSSSSSLRTNYHNARHNQIFEKQNYSHMERGVKTDKHYFGNESNHRHRRSSSHEINDGEDVEKCFSSATEWRQPHDHAYQSMLNADMSDADDGQMDRERYYQEKRRVMHDNSVDGEFAHYTDYKFGERLSPEVRGRYRDKVRFAKSNDEHFRHANHLKLYPSRKDSERDWPAAGFPFQNSRNRCIDNKRIHNAKMVHYHRDGYHQKNNDSIPRSALCSDTVEADRFILPIKRKLHADLGSMNQKSLADLSLLKGRRMMHDQSVVNDRRIYALRRHKFTDEIDTKVICNSGDMRNSNTVSKICIGRRHELKNSDNIHLSDRKIKFERRGNELRRVIEDDQKGCLPVAKDLQSSKQQHVHQNVRKQSLGYDHLGNQNLKKSAHQNQQNEDGEIEEGELIEQDHQDVISTSELKRRKVVLKSVIEMSSAEQPQLNDAMAEDAVCTNGATRECDKHILEIMEKMQKRRERFKMAIAPKKDDGDKKELSAVACSTDHIQNQRPVRKRRWGGGS